MRIHGGYFVFYSLWVCFGCFVWFGLVFSSRFFRSKWSISAMCIFLGSIVISHRLSRSIFRSPSLSISLAARSATRRQKKRVFRPKQRDLLFVSFFWVTSGTSLVWTYKRQRKKEVTNLNHSKFARMFIFLSLNGGKLNKKNEINNVQTHRERETKSQCVAVPLISSNVTQIVKSFQAIKVEQKYSREKQKRKNE